MLDDLAAATTTCLETEMTPNISFCVAMPFSLSFVNKVQSKLAAVSCSWWLRQPCISANRDARVALDMLCTEHSLKTPTTSKRWWYRLYLPPSSRHLIVSEDTMKSWSLILMVSPL